MAFCGGNLLCFLVCVLPAIGQKLSKERMIEYFQYANVSEDDIDDLITNVNSYSYLSNRRHAAETWVNNRISKETDEYAKNISNFVRSLHKANGFLSAVLLETLKTTHFVSRSKVKKLRQQYYSDQEKLYGNDILYSFTELYTKTREVLEFNETTMLELSGVLEDHIRTGFPNYYSGRPDLWQAYTVTTWPKLYLNLNLTDTTNDPMRDQFFKKVLYGLLQHIGKQKSF